MSRNASGEERCVTTLKTAVRDTNGTAAILVCKSEHDLGRVRKWGGGFPFLTQRTLTTMLDGTTRLTSKGRPVYRYYGLGTGTFSEYSALQKNSVQRTLGAVSVNCLLSVICYRRDLAP